MRPAGVALALAGCVLLMSALIYNVPILRFLSRKSELHPDSVALVHEAQIAFALAGTGLLSVAIGAHHFRWLRALLDRGAVANLVLPFVLLVVPLFLVELALRAPARSGLRDKTIVFMRDEVLAWKLSPGAHTSWLGVEVDVNRKGLRGPEVPYERRPGVARVLWLGDSVTFGYRLPWQQAFPYQAELLLERVTGQEIETVNSGVDGYSPWQQRVWLEREGLRYAPDIVVVSFVLNDVTEQNSPTNAIGIELSMAATWVDRAFGHSAIVHFTRQLGARLRFGRDVSAGARKAERLAVERLARSPDSEDVQRAWRVTLEELSGLFAVCREHGIRPVLIAFPFTFQFENPTALTAPQRILAEFAARERVPYLDLLPHLRSIDAEASTLFFDADHPTEFGSHASAERISSFLIDENLVAFGTESHP